MRDVLWDSIPAKEKERILSQDHCELDCEFLGFTEVYFYLSKMIPKHFTVIDFGCYLAAQCYCFPDHEKYIGVDVVEMERFVLSNTKHYICTIQDFVATYLGELDIDTTFAICSCVPDWEAQKMIRESFTNVFVYYPAKRRLKS